MLKEYKQQREELLAKYDKILELDIFPVESDLQNAKLITKEDVLVKKKQLQDKQFLVSITGQVNAGKSTLINALIFRDEVLPTDPAPHTAKITTIEYAPTPSIEITFYNKDEWQKVKDTPEFDNFIKEDIERSIQNGVLPNSVILDSSKIIKDDIANLKEYVTAKTNFTPYVKQVDVYYPSEILKDISIVDTPGTEDPNPIRARVTKEWIDKTNANIYAIYAGQAFNDKDFEFLDNYLLHVPKEQKITVLNKIDTLTDESQLKSYIENNILNDEDMKLRKIAQKDSLTYVSSLGALIDRMLFDKKELNENMEEYADILDDKGFLEEKKHNFNSLEKMIEQKLMANKGANILNTHTTYISSLFERKEKYFKAKIEIENSNIKDMDVSKDEIVGKLKTINNIIEKLEKGIETVKKNIEKLNADKEDDIFKDINHIYKSQKSKALNKVNSYDKSDFKSNRQINILWYVKDLFDESLEKVGDVVLYLEETLKTDITSKLSELKKQIKMVNQRDSIDLSFMQNFEKVASIKEMEEKLKSNIEDSFSKDKLVKIYEDRKKFLYTFQDDIGKMKTEIESIVEGIFNDIKKSIREMILNGLSNILNSKMGELEGSIRPILTEKQDELGKLKDNFDEKEKLINEKREVIKSYESELKIIESLKTQVEG